MKWWLPHEFEKKKSFLLKRAALNRAIRDFFDGQGFHEVETPALQACPTVDTHIHGFKTGLVDVGLKPLRDLYLHTSPEFAMKKLLVAGMPKIYQLCHVFRNGEDTRLHSPEFTMLEWYKTGDYRQILEDSIGLLRFCAEKLGIQAYKHNGHIADPFLNWNIISVSEAFDQYAGIDLTKFLNDTPGFNAAIQALGIRTAPDDRWDDLFFRVMAAKIEPNLGMGVPCILYDYPALMGALARKRPDDPRFAERFEIFVCGVELANGFGELTNPTEQRQRIVQDMALKKEIYGYDYPVDEDFIKALEHGMPEAGGNALGVDRLAMLATDAEDILQVLWTGKP